MKQQKIQRQKLLIRFVSRNWEEFIIEWEQRICFWLQEVREAVKGFMVERLVCDIINEAQSMLRICQGRVFTGHGVRTIKMLLEPVKEATWWLH